MTPVKKRHWYSVAKGMVIGLAIAVIPFLVSFISTLEQTLYTAGICGFLTWFMSYLTTIKQMKVTSETTTVTTEEPPTTTTLEHTTEQTI